MGQQACQRLRPGEKGHKLRSIAIVLAILLLCACGKPRPLIFQEQEMYMAKQQCTQEATSVNSWFPGPDNPEWTDYFLMRMRQMGITPQALSRMWW